MVPIVSSVAGKKVWANTLNTAQRLHEQNSEVIKAKAGARPPVIPEPQVRQHLVKSDQAMLEKLSGQAGKLRSEVDVFEANLQPFAKYDPGEATLRGEIRSYLRSLPNGKRFEALKDRDMLKAALESGAPPALSGLSAEQHKMLFNRAVEAANPEATETVKNFRVMDE